MTQTQHLTKALGNPKPFVRYLSTCKWNLSQAKEDSKGSFLFLLEKREKRERKEREKKRKRKGKEREKEGFLFLLEKRERTERRERGGNYAFYPFSPFSPFNEKERGEGGGRAEKVETFALLCPSLPFFVGSFLNYLFLHCLKRSYTLLFLMSIQSASLTRRLRKRWRKDQKDKTFLFLVNSWLCKGKGSPKRYTPSLVLFSFCRRFYFPKGSPFFFKKEPYPFFFKKKAFLSFLRKRPTQYSFKDRLSSLPQPGRREGREGREKYKRYKK